MSEPSPSPTPFGADQVDAIPHKWLELILHFLTGFRNDTVDFSKPHLRPSVAKIYPLFVFIYALLVTAGALANIAMVVSILRDRLYKDQTYCYLLNSALADTIKCLFVLPVTLTVLLVQNWIFGNFLCYFLPMLQDGPLHVSTLTFLLLAWDRYRYLRRPLKPRIPAFVCATGSWLMAICIVLPYPIYTTYLDLGKYLKQFRGVGICAVNLADDMQEYMRGLFIAMYVLPLGMTAYLHIRMSRELQLMEAPLPVMMYEPNHRPSNQDFSFSVRSGSRGETGREVYEAELDVRKEKRTQKYLGAMAAVYAACLFPLMVLRVAKLAMTETYENSGHFDITYTMFVWIAFLPTCTTPIIYAAWRMSRSTKERLRGYLRLSSRRSRGGENGQVPVVSYSDVS